MTLPLDDDGLVERLRAVANSADGSSAGAKQALSQAADAITRLIAERDGLRDDLALYRPESHSFEWNGHRYFASKEKVRELNGMISVVTKVTRLGAPDGK